MRLAKIKTAIALTLATTVIVAPIAMAQGVGDVGPRPPGAGGGFGNRTPLPPLVVPEDTYLSWPLLPSQSAYADINGKRMKGYLNDIVAISRKSKADGNQYWGRIASTPYDKMTRDYMMAHFKRLGLEQLADHPITQKPMWWPSSWEATVEMGGRTVPLKTVFSLGGESTPAAGVNVPIVWVGLGTAADFSGRDVRGKAVLIHSVPQPGRRENSALSLGAITRAKAAGAALVILELALPGMPDAVTQPGVGGGGEDAVSESLLISVGPAEGDAIREAIGKGETPTLHYKQTVTRKGGETGVIVGFLPGATDEYIMIEAHSDSFFDGAMDNASGLSQVIGLAEHYSKIPKAQRRRGLMFVVNSDHHSGSAGLLWVRNNLGAQLDKTVLDINCEHPSQTQFYPISGGLQSSNMMGAKRVNIGGVNGTARLRDLIQKTFRDFGVAVYARPDGADPASGNGTSSAPPRIGVIDHILYHTSMDTADWVPAIGIERVTQAYAKIIDDVNKLDYAQVRNPKASVSSR